jgi:hypothetical protein
VPGDTTDYYTIQAGLWQADGIRSSDQQDIWSRIAEKSARLGAASEKSAMSAMFDARHVALDEFVAAFTPVERQGGAVFTGEWSRRWTRAVRCTTHVAHPGTGTDS